MDRSEKLQFQQSIENYFEEKRVYSLFEKLLKELVVSQPNDPIDYLIKRLKTPDVKRIFITGSAGVKRKEVALSLANHFDYEGISIGDILRKEISKKLDIGKKIEPYLKVCKLVPDDIIIDLLKQELIRLEKNNVSYVVEGFPRNRVQAMFLQSVGILPDNVIILDTSNTNLQARVSEKIPINQEKPKNHPIQVNEAIEEYHINVKAVKDVFPSHLIYNIKEGSNISTLIDDLSRILKLKNKTLGARRPPRIILQGPPCSRKSEVAEIIAKKYGIVNISVSSLLLSEIRKSNDNSKAILAQMQKGELIDDKYVFKLLEERLLASDAMINGWILTGFPKNSSQLKFIENEYNKAFKPSLIVCIELEDDVVLKRSSLRRIDPFTGTCVYIDSQTFDPNSELAKRLIIKNEDKEEILKRRLENWKNFAYTELTQLQGVIRINGEKVITNLVELLSDAMENSN